MKKDFTKNKNSVRNFKQEIENFKLPYVFGESANCEKIKLNNSVSHMLSLLDCDISTSVESARQCGKTTGALCYASKMLEETDDYVVIYTHNLDQAKMMRSNIIEISNVNNLNIDRDNILKRVILNPSKKEFMRILNKVCFVIYNDLGFNHSRVTRQINLKTASKVLSVIVSADQTTLLNRTGYDNFSHIKYDFWEDGKDLDWYRRMCISMAMDWYCIRNEILLDHSRSTEPAPYDQLNIICEG